MSDKRRAIGRSQIDLLSHSLKAFDRVNSDFRFIPPTLCFLFLLLCPVELDPHADSLLLCCL